MALAALHANRLICLRLLEGSHTISVLIPTQCILLPLSYVSTALTILMPPQVLAQSCMTSNKIAFHILGSRALDGCVLLGSVPIAPFCKQNLGKRNQTTKHLSRL